LGYEEKSPKYEYLEYFAKAKPSGLGVFLFLDVKGASGISKTSMGH
jgi:hypothetical protein